MPLSMNLIQILPVNVATGKLISKDKQLHCSVLKFDPPEKDVCHVFYSEKHLFLCGTRTDIIFL